MGADSEGEDHRSKCQWADHDLHRRAECIKENQIANDVAPTSMRKRGGDHVPYVVRGWIVGKPFRKTGFDARLKITVRMFKLLYGVSATFGCAHQVPRSSMLGKLVGHFTWVPRCM